MSGVGKHQRSKRNSCEGSEAPRNIKIVQFEIKILAPTAGRKGWPRNQRRRASRKVAALGQTVSGMNDRVLLRSKELDFLGPR